MVPHSSILAWRIPWAKEPMGYSPWGHKELDMTEHLYDTQSTLEFLCAALRNFFLSKQMDGFCTRLNNPISFALASGPYIILHYYMQSRVCFWGVSSPLACGFCSQVIDIDKSLSHVQLFVTLWTVAYQAPLSMGFSRQEYWSGLPFPSPKIFL